MFLSTIINIYYVYLLAQEMTSLIRSVNMSLSGSLSSLGSVTDVLGEKHDVFWRILKSVTVLYKLHSLPDLPTLQRELTTKNAGRS